jgi:hypothetical protein
VHHRTMAKPITVSRVTPAMRSVWKETVPSVDLLFPFRAAGDLMLHPDVEVMRQMVYVDCADDPVVPRCGRSSTNCYHRSIWTTATHMSAMNAP